MIDRGRRLGVVTAEERDELQRIHEHANGLLELELVLEASSPLRQQVALDRLATDAARRRWWSTVAAHHQWTCPECCHWRIDFHSRELWLVAEPDDESAPPQRGGASSTARTRAASSRGR